MTIKKKLVSAGIVLLLVPMLIISILSYNKAKDEFTESGEILLKNAVEQVQYMIKLQQQAVESGGISVEEAQENIKTLLLGPKNDDGTRPINDTIYLGGTGYFVIYSEDGVEVMHPSLEGVDVWDVEDKSEKGIKLVQEQIKIAKSGGGYFEYMWTLPNSDETEMKISYQSYDETWGWIVSAGAYESEFNAQASEMFRILLLVISVTIIIGTIAMYFFASALSKNIRFVDSALERVASGDLTGSEIHVKTKDETKSLSESYNLMLENLKGMIKNSSSTTESVAQTAERLSKVVDESTNAINEVVLTIQEIAEAVSEEAEGAEKVSDKMNNLSGSIQKLTELSDVMNHSVSKTEDENKKGISSMEALGRSSENSLKVVHEISEVIDQVKLSNDKISTFTDVINSIAEQTNLLALNASIEAARAGEAGRGFSVVAEEIRKLAEESAHSVSEIKGIVSEIDLYSKQSVDKMQQVTSVVGDQNQVVNQTVAQFENISHSVENLSKSIELLNREITRIANIREDMLSSVMGISASTEETSAATEEVSASAQQQLAGITEIDQQMKGLVEVVHGLEVVISKFKI